MRNEWLQVVTLGVVQGITEYLPISSTAHLLITADLFNFQYSIGGTFEIFIQLGTVIAVVVFYMRDLLEQLRGLRSDAEVRRFWLGIVLAFIPAAIIGLTFRDWIKLVLFESPSIIATSLIVGGIIFIVIERIPPRENVVTDVKKISFRQALGIGIAQVAALVPGVSRSGASIVGGMLAGLDRKVATTFSFYLAMPTLGAATIVDLLASLDQVTPDDVGRLLVGTIVAGIVGWLSIGWLLRYVATNSFVAFGVYRIIAGVVILVLVATGLL
ncbi:MAG: undecaprenyl-diphosphate phosphatase [Chloroflexaceae bacterium]|nr:undecaprenyl-diphosphate phosphatase [Chloroflexaceae bacterium]NJO07920.1 undecaprenyl-diphosphate phosphatase [Chloroflexaceae bacterium]